MKIYLPFSLLVGLLVCCAQDDSDNINELSLVNNRFTHDIPSCVKNDQAEINCMEFIEFVDGSRVSALLGGGDIVMEMNYQHVGDQITLEGYNLQLILRIKDESTLIDISDNSVWQKK